MAQHIVDTIYEGGICRNGIQVDDANELLDLGLGQYIMDHEPGTTYYVDGDCSTVCRDEATGKDWENCKGWISPTVATVKKNRKNIEIFIIAGAIGAALLWYLVKRKRK